MNHKVHLPGHGTFWFLAEADKSGPLAPLDHCDDSGNVHPYDALCSDSYAHVFEDGTIKRYQEVIGNITDLVDAEGGSPGTPRDESH